MSDQVQLGLYVAVLNICFWIFIFLIQRWERGQGKIPPRKKHGPRKPEAGFLYMQDFFTNGPIGDLIGFSLIDAGVAVSWYMAGWMQWMIIPVALAVILTFLFYKSCARPSHKPDWGYLEGGKITWGGRTHLVYAFCQGSLVGIGLVLLCASKMTGAPLIMYVTGIVIWIACFIADVKTKRWQLLSS